MSWENLSYDVWLTKAHISLRIYTVWSYIAANTQKYDQDWILGGGGGGGQFSCDVQEQLFFYPYIQLKSTLARYKDVT